MIKKALPVIVIVGFALFLASMMFWTSDVVVKSEMEDQQTIEQKLDEILELKLAIEDRLSEAEKRLMFLEYGNALDNESIKTLGRIIYTIHLPDKEIPEALMPCDVKMPVFTDANDGKAKEYSKQFQEEIE